MIDVADMAYELAEYEFLHAPVQWILDTYQPDYAPGDSIQEAMDRAWHAILRDHTSRPQKDIIHAYIQLTGESDYE